MFVGKEGVGKNWLANQVMAQQQRIFGDNCKIGVVTTEMPYDKGFAHLGGVKVAMSGQEIDSIVKTAKKNGYEDELTDEYLASLEEKIGEFLVVPPYTAETLFDITVDMVASREFNLILIDSFGALLTEGDEEKSMQDNSRVAGAAGLNTRLMSKLCNSLGYDDSGDPNLTCVIGLNQMRANIGAAMNQRQTKEGGGWAIKHARWVCLELTRVGQITKEVVPPGSKSKKKVRVGKVVKWDVTKQKAGGHEGHTGEYPFIWSKGGIPLGEHLVEVARTYGITTRSGAWWSYGEDSLGQGLEKAGQALEDDPELYSEILQLTLKAAGVRANYGD